MTKKRGFWIAGAALVALVGLGAGVFLFGPHDAPAQGAGAPGGQQQAVPVPALEAEFEPVQIWNDYSGRLQAVDFVEVRPQVSGKIVEVKFKDGDLVNKGDTLFVIDPRPYQATLDQAQADLQKAKNEYTLAQKELDRARALIKTQAIAASVLDERQSAANVAKSAVAAAEASVEDAKLDLEYANVLAPISGRASRVEVTLGNLVQIGAPVLTTIVSNEGIYADFDVDEQTYLGLMDAQGGVSDQREMKIPVRLIVGRDPDSARVIDGHIRSFDNRIDTSSGTIRARALFDNKNGALLPGMFVTVRLGSPSMQRKILIPSSAVGTDQDRKFVYAIGDDNKLSYREVSLGASVNGKRVVESGLEPGEKIVADGIMKLRPDMVVAPQGQTAAAPPEQPGGAPADH